MSTAYKPTDYPGVRYREHPTRRRGARPDRYFVIRYAYAGKMHEEALGWASDGYNAEQASQVRGQLRQNQKLGRGPCTLAKMRAEADIARREAEEASKAKDELPATFNALADAYMAWAKGNKKDHASDERRLRLHIRPVLGPLALGKIRPAQIEALKDGLVAKKLAPASVVHCVVLVHMVFSHGRRIHGQAFADLVGENPTTGVKLPKVRNGRTRHLKKPEVEKLLAQARRTDPLLHNIIMLCLYTGLRRGEVERMQAMDVDTEAQVLHVRDAKSGDSDTVDLPDFLLPLLTRLTDGLDPGALVFPSWRTGGELKSISVRFKRLVDSVKFNKGVTDKRHMVTFHTLRHTYISRLVIQGVDLRTVQEMARHRSFAMTLRYAHLAPGGKRRAANRQEQPGSNVVPLLAGIRRRS
ncbi:MAG: tyrosine-type recombinase/integrase [Humidesulfovibrio sp.]